MAYKRFTDKKKIMILKSVRSGSYLRAICSKYGISETTYYNWKRRIGAMSTSQVTRLRAIDRDNRRLKHRVADLMRDNRALRTLSSKNFVSPKSSG
jgi:putative transposase